MPLETLYLRRGFLGNLMRFALLALFPLAALAAELKPLMVETDKVIFLDDFTQAREIKAAAGAAAKNATAPQPWNPNQGTRWTVADGVLKGQASTPEYQSSHDSHKGVHPRIVLNATPAEYAVKFSFRLIDGKAFDAANRKSVSPFLEFGHHISRISWGAEGAMLLADADSLAIDTAKGFNLETGKWYTVLAERRADEIYVQFQDGPSFHGKHASYKSDPHAVMIAGLEAGKMEIDNVTVWSIKAGTNPAWEATLKAHPAIAEIRLHEAKPAAEAAPKKAKK